MRCIISENTDPYFNIASEEYLLKNFNDDLFLLYRNEPSIVVGKHQNTLSEINYHYVLEKDLKVVRRISGGGTVFHDLGNLNFSFITTGEPGLLVDYKKYLKPIVEALKSLGLKATISERNDLFLKGKKITGTASHVHKSRVMHHGTLLFSSEMSDLSEALHNAPSNYSDKAVKSIRSKVTNIGDHLNNDMDVIQFRDILIGHILETFDDASLYEYSDTDLKEISKLRLNKFSKWNWNYGYSPKYHFRKENASPGGNLEVRMNVEKGVITKLRICGDIINVKDLGELEEMLTGTIHDPAMIRRMLSKVDVSDFIREIDNEDLIAAMF